LKLFADRCSIRQKYLNSYKNVFSEFVYTAANKGIDISFKAIDDSVISDLKNQWQSSTFDWPALFRKYRRFCKRVDFALYYNDQLIALLYGKASVRRRVLRVDYIEATSKELRPPNLTEIAAMVLATIEEIGKQLDSEFVALRNPTNERVCLHYSKYEYSFDVKFDGARAKTMYKKIR